VDETRARVLLEQGSLRAAESTIREAVRVLSKDGEQGALAEALTTQARILSKLGNYVESANTLRRAADLAEEVGAVEDAGRALLSLIEEHGERIAEHELLDAYERANNLLRETQDAETMARLRGCATAVISVAGGRIRDESYKEATERPSLAVSFDEFPKEVRTYCEQYLLYFIQFLQDLGVEATSDIKHEAGHVLFTVTPSDERDALENIWTALKIYLNLPGNTIKTDAGSDIAVQRLEYAVTGLQRELRLAEAELQAKNATIEAQQLTINVQKGLLSGEVILNPPNDAAPASKMDDREELFGGVATITVFEKPGFAINHPKLYRLLKGLFPKHN
jgi:tetratricopeptide (TPR) repeat protein